MEGTQGSFLTKTTRLLPRHGLLGIIFLAIIYNKKIEKRDCYSTLN